MVSNTHTHSFEAIISFLDHVMAALSMAWPLERRFCQYAGAKLLELVRRHNTEHLASFQARAAHSNHSLMYMYVYITNTYIYRDTHLKTDPCAM